jgi:predicted nucleic acid-binding protein
MMRVTPSFVDSNVFLYVFGADHPLQEPCARVLTRIATVELVATTSTEVVQEVVHVLRRKGRYDLAVQDPSLLTREAVHAGTMQSHGITRIITADQHFDRIEGIVRVAPG